MDLAHAISGGARGAGGGRGAPRGAHAKKYGAPSTPRVCVGGAGGREERRKDVEE
jgi:hypothetical protein